ncbi:MAG: hypothetical protein EOM23_07395, partial [Candidatus Moranbacteria bacterium]|nr:hypothetical protein [Candidatus Moranbacteria bacterium]
MKKMKINNMSDLRFRKLYLRSEIRIKEEKIIKHAGRLQDDIQKVNVKNDIIQGILNNPAIVINAARITFDLVSRWKRRREKRRNR